LAIAPLQEVVETTADLFHGVLDGGLAPPHIAFLNDNREKRQALWWVCITQHCEQLGKHNLPGVGRDPMPEALAGPQIRCVEINRRKRRKVPSLDFLTSLSNEECLALENRYAAEDEVPVRSVALIPRLIKVEEVHKKKATDATLCGHGSRRRRLLSVATPVYVGRGLLVNT